MANDPAVAPTFEVEAPGAAPANQFEVEAPVKYAPGRAFGADVAKGMGLDADKIKAAEDSGGHEAALKEIGSQVFSGLSGFAGNVLKDPAHIADPFNATASALTDALGLPDKGSVLDPANYHRPSAGKLVGALSNIFGGAEAAEKGPGVAGAAGKVAGKVLPSRTAIGDFIRTEGELRPSVKLVSKAGGGTVGGAIGYAIPIPGSTLAGAHIGERIGPLLTETMFPESAASIAARRAAAAKELLGSEVAKPAPAAAAAPAPTAPAAPAPTPVGPPPPKLAPPLMRGAPKPTVESVVNEATGAKPLAKNIPLKEQLATAPKVDPLVEKYPDPAIRKFVRANGEKVVEAAAGDPATLEAVHNLTRVDLREALIKSGEDMGQTTVSNSKFAGEGSIGREQAFNKLLSKGLTPAEIVDMAKSSAKSPKPPILSGGPADFYEQLANAEVPEVENVMEPTGPRNNASGESPISLENLSREKSGMRYYSENPDGIRRPILSEGVDSVASRPGWKVIIKDASGRETIREPVLRTRPRPRL